VQFTHPQPAGPSDDWRPLSPATSSGKATLPVTPCPRNQQRQPVPARCAAVERLLRG
jgi:hypothetical protein